MERWQGTVENMAVNLEFWKNKTILITGHTGFKGAWLSLWLQSLGANVIGYALQPPTTPSLYEKADVASGMVPISGDIRDLQHLKTVFNEHQPDIVFHLAAQSLVRYSYQNPIETYETNVMGTLNVLEAIRSVNSVRAVILVTTDKCYENKEWVWAYRENEAMGGHDPYSSSKGCAELLIASYRHSFFSEDKFDEHKTAIASVRAGNVIGGGDWAEDRLVPDIIRAIQSKEIMTLRSPNALRPWQHVLEPLCGYMMLAEKLYNKGVEYAQGWNFGPLEADVKPVKWIVKSLIEAWGDTTDWTLSDNRENPHEANVLKLDCAKAHQMLSWWPRWDLNTTLVKIVDWHKAEQTKLSLKAACLKQISEYTHETIR